MDKQSCLSFILENNLYSMDGRINIDFWLHKNGVYEIKDESPFITIINTFSRKTLTLLQISADVQVNTLHRVRIMKPDNNSRFRENFSK